MHIIPLGLCESKILYFTHPFKSQVNEFWAIKDSVDLVWKICSCPTSYKLCLKCSLLPLAMTVKCHSKATWVWTWTLHIFQNCKVLMGEIWRKWCYNGNHSFVRNIISNHFRLLLSTLYMYVFETDFHIYVPLINSNLFFFLNDSRYEKMAKAIKWKFEALMTKTSIVVAHLC